MACISEEWNAGSFELDLAQDQLTSYNFGV